MVPRIRAILQGVNPSLFGNFLTFCGPAYFLTRAEILTGKPEAYGGGGY